MSSSSGKQRQAAVSRMEQYASRPSVSSSSAASAAIAIKANGKQACSTPPSLPATPSSSSHFSSYHSSSHSSASSSLLSASMSSSMKHEVFDFGMRYSGSLSGGASPCPLIVSTQGQGFSWNRDGTSCLTRSPVPFGFASFPSARSFLLILRQVNLRTRGAFVRRCYPKDERRSMS